MPKDSSQSTAYDVTCAGHLNLQTVDSFSGLRSLDECGRLLDCSKPPVKKLDRKLGAGCYFDQREKLYRRKN